MRSFANAHALAAVMILLPAALLAADVDTKFHNAPASAQARRTRTQARKTRKPESSYIRAIACRATGSRDKA